MLSVAVLEHHDQKQPMGEFILACGSLGRVHKRHGNRGPEQETNYVFNCKHEAENKLEEEQAMEALSPPSVTTSCSKATPPKPS